MNEKNNVNREEQAIIDLTVNTGYYSLRPMFVLICQLYVYNIFEIIWGENQILNKIYSFNTYLINQWIYIQF